MAKKPLTDAYMKSALPKEALIDRTFGAPIDVDRAVGIIAQKLMLLPQTEDLLACWHVVQMAALDSSIKRVAYPNVKQVSLK